MTPRSATAVDELASRLAAAGLEVGRNVAIGPSTTYRVGGSAALHLTVGRIDDLGRIGRARAGLDVAVLVVGRGSNLLVADEGFDGLAVTLAEPFAGVEIVGETAVAGGAASLPVVARRTASAGLAGFEWAVGVPGSIGGAVRMNVGGHGSDMAVCTLQVRVVDLDGGEDVEVSVEQLDFGYRRSAVRSTQVVATATLALRRGDPVASEVEIAEIVRWRREHQPGGTNVGSVFTNPDGDAAGRLADTAQCRGLRVGSAAVSDKHANFIQADAGGRSADVAALMAEIRRRVRDTHGVELAAETVMVGFDDAVVRAAGGRS